MPARSDTSRLRDESGLTLIEVLAAGVLLAIAMGAMVTLLGATGRAGADQRERTESYSLAQQDQARMRSLRISELLALNQTRTVIQGGTTYTITSTGQFVSDATGTVSCDAATASADYIRITSSVNWGSGRGHPPTVIQSVVAPPNGSIAADRGALAVAVRDGESLPLQGIPLSGSGAGSFSGTTNANGCAFFANLPQGNYTLTPSAATGVVGIDGQPPGPLTTSVVGQSTNTVVLFYDEPGAVNVTFKTRIGGSVQTTTNDTIVAFNSGMSKAAVFGTVGSRVSGLTGTPLFPFASPDSVYAGTCTANNPNPDDEEDPPAAPAIASVNIEPGATGSAQIQLPALALTVRSGSNSGSPGSLVNNANVKITDNDCTVPGTSTLVKRSYRTNTSGTLATPGLPYGVYDICADNGTRRFTLNDVPVQTTAADTIRTIYLGTLSGSTSGTCP